MDKMKNISKSRSAGIKRPGSLPGGTGCEPHTCTECGSECTLFSFDKGERSVHMSLAEMHLLPVWMVWGKSLLMV